MELSYNLRMYLKLYKQSEETIDVDEQDDLLSQMEELYYELDDEELAYLEKKQIV